MIYKEVGRCSPLTYVSIQTAYMTIDVNPQASFSLIADFDGNMDELMHTPFDTTLPAIALRNMMLFPGVVGSVAVNRTMSLKVVNQSLKKGSLIAVLAQKNAHVDEPERKDFYDEGVVARVMRTIDLPNPMGGKSCMAILQTYGPLKLEKITRRKPTMRVEVSPIEEVIYDKDDEKCKQYKNHNAFNTFLFHTDHLTICPDL